MVITLRTDHNVDHRRAANDLRTLGLCDTSGDDDLHVAPVPRRVGLCFAQPAELGIDFLRRLLANVAGVQDDEIGIGGAVRLDEILARKRVHHALCIVDIHLTAV